MFKETRKELKEFRLPKYEDIPDVGLYLDQVVKYINSFFVNFEDMQVTPSMLTNYVKHKIVAKVHKKQYSRDQIAHFIFITCVKNVLSLDNIRLAFEILEDNDFSDAYDEFVYELDNNLNQKDNKTKEQSMISNIVKALTQKMLLDKYFKNLK